MAKDNKKESFASTSNMKLAPNIIELTLPCPLSLNRSDQCGKYNYLVHSPDQLSDGIGTTFRLPERITYTFHKQNEHCYGTTLYVMTGNIKTQDGQYVTLPDGTKRKIMDDGYSIMNEGTRVPGGGDELMKQWPIYSSGPRVLTTISLIFYKTNWGWSICKKTPYDLRSHDIVGDILTLDGTGQEKIKSKEVPIGKFRYFPYEQSHTVIRKLENPCKITISAKGQKMPRCLTKKRSRKEHVQRVLSRQKLDNEKTDALSATSRHTYLKHSIGEKRKYSTAFPEARDHVRRVFSRQKLVNNMYKSASKRFSFFKF